MVRSADREVTYMHMRYPQEANDDHDIADLARRINFGAKARCPKHNDAYDLKDFTLEKAKENCNGILLTFISKLISMGSINK